MKVAVAAASGRLGHAILRLLPAQVGAGNVVGIARQADRIQVPGIEKRQGDYASVESMTAALRGIDTVIMISAPVAGGTDRASLHRNGIEAAHRAGVQWVIFTSIIGNGREAETWFGATQQVNRETEADLRSSGLAWTIGRNGLYLDLDLEHIIRANAADGIYTNPGGDGRCGYITVDEIAFAYAHLVTDRRHQGQTYNIVGENHTQAELVGAANEAFGLNVRYQPITDEECVVKFRTLMAHRGEAVARMLTGAFQCIRTGAYDVSSDFEVVAGRRAKSVVRMMADLREQRRQSV